MDALRVVCPRCGRSVDVLIGGLCSDCFAETRGLARLPSSVEGEVCKYCGAVRLGGRWVQAGGFDEAVEVIARYVVSHAKPVEPLERVELASIDYETLPNWRTRVKLRLRGEYRGRVIEGLQEAWVTVKPSVCPLCRARLSGEYDVLLQVRGGDPSRLEELVYGVLEALGIERQTVDVIPGREGVDVYFTNPGGARKVARELAKTLGGRLSRSEYEEVGLNASGKRRARKTILLRVEGDKI